MGQDLGRNQDKWDVRIDQDCNPLTALMQICEGAACIRAPHIFYIILTKEGSWNHAIYNAQASHPGGLKFELYRTPFGVPLF